MANALLDTRRVVKAVRTLWAVPYTTVLKWNSNQPRNPAGTSTGGRWASAMTAPTSDIRGISTAPGMEKGWGSANYADIMNAPMGTGFGNTPRITGDPELVKRLTTPVSKPVTATAATLEVLKTAGVADSEMMDEQGANMTLKVTLDDPDGTEAVFKPEAGELWGSGFTNSDIDDYITNKEFSLAEREAVAFEVSDALQLGLVPETVLREDAGVDLDQYDEGGGGGVDSDDARYLYDQYKDKAQDAAMDAVGEEMHNLFQEAKEEHAKNIDERVEEMRDLWKEVVEEEYPGTPITPEDLAVFEASQRHPVLPMGSLPAFERKEPPVIDPLEVIDAVKIGVDSELSEYEIEGVKAEFRKHLDQGVALFGEVSPDDAKEHLDYDQFIEEHQDTEARMYDSKIQSFDSWRNEHGMGSRQQGSLKNLHTAPHPQGGSFQAFVPGLSTQITPSEADTIKFAVLDYALGSMDRHGKNVGEDENGHAVAIDNGYSMPDVDSDHFTFRSDPVRRWLSYGESTVPQEFRDKTLALLQETPWESLLKRHPNMNESEREAFFNRVSKLKVAMQTDTGLYKLWRKQRVM